MTIHLHFEGGKEMLLDLVNHPKLRRTDQLMSILYYLGMASSSQLSTIMMVSERNFFSIYQQIRSRAEKPEERDLWIHSYRAKSNRLGRMYALGPNGTKYAQELLGYSGNAKVVTVTGGQMEHYRGLNEILVRILKQVDRAHIKWYPTQEASYELYRQWEWKYHAKWRKDPKQQIRDRASLIRPDALLIIHGQRYWIEYDTGKEWLDQLEGKFKRYIDSFEPLDHQKNLVIWVTDSEKRAKNMQAIWEYRKKLTDKITPEMYFFESGEETQFILDMVKANTQLVSR
jgi:hypothetical protein